MDAKRREFYARKDKLMAERKESGQWPCLECEGCRRVGGCCQGHHHHVGDSCTHCGNDETGALRTWTSGHAGSKEHAPT